MILKCSVYFCRQTGEEYSKTGCVWLEQNQIAKAIVPTFVTGAPRLSSVPQMNLLNPTLFSYILLEMSLLYVYYL
jgi:hypothetical protein